MATIDSKLWQSGNNDPSPEGELPTVLIVDDSRDSANMLASLFDARRYETHVAYDWAAALEASRIHVPDVFLLDLGMPELDGVHLARLLREDEQLKDSVLVAVTGYDDELHRAQCKAAGFDAIVPKTAKWEDLKSIVDRLWSQRKKH